MKENKKKNPLQALSALLLLVLLLHSSCADDKKADIPGGGEGKHTVRLTLSVSTTPIPETKAVVQRARPGSEAEAAGFHYELVSSDTDTTATAVLTKAPSTLKNVYALLFTSAGSFNGRANLGTITSSAEISIVFTDVVDANAANCRLVIVANDNDNTATTNYSSSGGTGGFASFTGTYSEFQALTMTNAVSKDEDIPYAGSVMVNLADFGGGSAVAVPLYRTLAKVTLNNTVSITGGPARSSITLYNTGPRRFATAGSDNYDGTGTTLTTSGYVASTPGNNATSNTWYVGENIRPAGTGINSISDRNSSKAPANACYIRVATATSSMNITPAVGEEYITGATGSFTYDIYLGKSSDKSDFSLRRHTNYTITSNVSGTVAEQVALAASDGRVTLSKTGGVAAGLNIGKLGGASGYTTGTGSTVTITGSYTKNLLLQPNTSGGDVSKQWSATSGQLQPDTRRFWDPTYTLAHIDQTSGTAYEYCKNLNVNGLTGWYLPTEAQLSVIYALYEDMKANGAFANYSAFDANYYWSSTENNASYAWCVYFSYGNVSNNSKTLSRLVRCVRDN